MSKAEDTLPHKAETLRTLVVGVGAAIVLGVVLLLLLNLSSGRNTGPIDLMAIDSAARHRPTAVVMPVRPAGQVQAPVELALAAPQPVVEQVIEQVIEAAAAVPEATPAIATPVATPTPARRDTRPSFDGRPLRKARTLQMVVTAYSPDARSCGKWADGITASGFSVWTNGMKLVAADTHLLPFGSVITVPGYHGSQPVPVLDRGGAIKGHRLDLLFPTHEEALKFGRKTLTVTVWEYAD